MLTFLSSLRQRGSLTSTLIILNPRQPGDAGAAVVLVPLSTTGRSGHQALRGVDVDLSTLTLDPDS